MFEPSTVTFIAGIISCIIGISSFVTGRMQKAEQNGALEAKINQALEGIAQANAKLEANSNMQTSIRLDIERHDGEIKTLFNQFKDFRETAHRENETREVLMELVQTLKHGMKV